jgi:uncharacterized OB-fold protein
MSTETSQSLDWPNGLQLTAGPYVIGLYQPSPETAGYWQGVREHQLLLKWCGHCSAMFHPKRIVCTQCGSSELTWRRASGRATVFSFSEVHHAADPAFAASVPYTVGLVLLEEGVHLLSRLIPEPGPIAVDAPAMLDFRVLEKGQVMPVFLVGRR